MIRITGKIGTAHELTELAYSDCGDVISREERQADDPEVGVGRLRLYSFQEFAEELLGIAQSDEWQIKIN